MEILFHGIKRILALLLILSLLSILFIPLSKVSAASNTIFSDYTYHIYAGSINTLKLNLLDIFNEKQPWRWYHTMSKDWIAGYRLTPNHNNTSYATLTLTKITRKHIDGKYFVDAKIKIDAKKIKARY